MNIKKIIAILAMVGAAWSVRAQEPATAAPVEPATTQEVTMEEVGATEVVLEQTPSVVEVKYPMTDFQERLAQSDSLGGARVVVRIHHSAEEAIEKYNAQTPHKEFYQGYRIRIFSSNNQSARTDAEAAVALFQENYNVPVYLAYENPYFLVTCGNCLTHEEAIMLLSKVRIHFPKAFVVTCEIPAEAITTLPAPLAPDNEEEVVVEEPAMTAEEPAATEQLPAPATYNTPPAEEQPAEEQPAEMI